MASRRFQDSVRLAFTSFEGINAGAATDSGWPAYSGATALPLGGTLRLANVSAATYQGGGVGGPRYWTYNMPLGSDVSGPAVVVEGGAAGGSAWVYVGTASGQVAGYAVAAPSTGPPPTLDPLWEAHDNDPDTQYHLSTEGAWYGGCGHACQVPGGVCPDVCPGGTLPAGFGAVSLSSNVRVLASY